MFHSTAFVVSSAALWGGLVIGIVIGFIFGLFFTAMRIARNWQKKIAGKLRIDRSDSDGPFCFLELKHSIESIEKQHIVLLEVDTHNLIPPK